MRALLSVTTTAQTALSTSGFALSILFLIFLGINLCWEVSLAVLVLGLVIVV